MTLLCSLLTTSIPVVHHLLPTPFTFLAHLLHCLAAIWPLLLRPLSLLTLPSAHLLSRLLLRTCLPLFALRSTLLPAATVPSASILTAIVFASASALTEKIRSSPGKHYQSECGRRRQF